MKRIYGLFAAVTLAASLIALSGCASGSEDDRFITAADVRGTTPELATITRSEGQLKNKEARVIDTYFRGLRSDISRALLLDTPTRLAPHPMP